MFHLSLSLKLTWNAHIMLIDNFLLSSFFISQSFLLSDWIIVFCFLFFEDGSSSDDASNYVTFEQKNKSFSPPKNINALKSMHFMMI